MWIKFTFLLVAVCACLMYGVTADWMERRFTNTGFPRGNRWPSFGFPQMTAGNPKYNFGEEIDIKDKFKGFGFSGGVNGPMAQAPTQQRPAATDDGIQQASVPANTQQKPLARFGFSGGVNSPMAQAPTQQRPAATDDGVQQASVPANTQQKPLARFRRDYPYGGGFGFGGGFWPGYGGGDFGGFDAPHDNYRRE